MKIKNEVDVEYWARGGIGCASSRIPWTIDLTDEELSFYKNAIENKIPLEEVKGLGDALDRAYEQVLECEKENAKEWRDEFDGDIGIAFVAPLNTY